MNEFATSCMPKRAVSHGESCLLQNPSPPYPNAWIGSVVLQPLRSFPHFLRIPQDRSSPYLAGLRAHIRGIGNSNPGRDFLGRATRPRGMYLKEARPDAPAAPTYLTNSARSRNWPPSS